MNAHGTETLMVFQPALTAFEVRLEREDKEAGRHWSWPGACWCCMRHQAGEKGVKLIAPPWSRSRRAESAGPAAAR